MKRHTKALVVVGLLLMLLAVVWWLCGPEPSQITPPRLSFIGFTNNSAGKRVAVLSISNTSHRPVLLGLFVELPTKDGGHERWAGGDPHGSPTALAASGTMRIETLVPDPGSIWRLHLIWMPKPSRRSYAYARGFDWLLTTLRKPSYPSGWVPSARVWRDIVTTPGPPPEGDAEHQSSPRGP